MKVDLVIFEDQYMEWYLSVTHRIILSDPSQVSSHEYIKYESHSRRIQNAVGHLLNDNRHIVIELLDMFDDDELVHYYASSWVQSCRRALELLKETLTLEDDVP